MASKIDGKSPKKYPTTKSPLKMDQNKYSPTKRSSPRAKTTCDMSRRIRDLCATWHELVQKWSSLNAIGLTVANNLINLQLQRQFNGADDSNSLTMFTKELNYNDLEEKCLKTFEELTKVVAEMFQICEKMEKITESFQAIQKLERLKDGKGEEMSVYFSSWPLQQYYISSLKLHKIYRKEFDLKEKVVPHFLKEKDRNQLMLYLSIWLNEPYLDRETQILLESMLIETGLR